MSPQAPKGFTEQFYGLIDETLAQAATKADVKDVIDTFLGLLRKFQKELETSMKETTDSVVAEKEKLVDVVSGTEKKLNDTIDKKIASVDKSVNDKVTELSGMIGYVESLISYYDDTEVRSQMKEIDTFMKDMHSKIPEAFDPSGIVKDIEDLEKKYIELDKKVSNMGGVRGTVGGVSNLRIQQAFKYILKTEAPSGLINGTNKEYTVTQPIFAVLAFSMNGEVIPQIPNYTISGNKITFSTALPAAYSGFDFEIKYV